MDKDTELLKIQILADYYHGRFTTFLSFIYGLLIAWVIAFVTLFFQKSIDPTTYLFGIIAGFIILAFVLIFANRDYSRNLDNIDKVFERLNKGEPLPSLRELRQKRLT